MPKATEHTTSTPTAPPPTAKTREASAAANPGDVPSKTSASVTQLRAVPSEAAPVHDHAAYVRAIGFLSFVKTLPKKGGGRVWWAVPDLENYSMECRLGEALGREYLAFSRRYEKGAGEACNTLAFVVSGMVARGKWSGTEMMFVQTIARAASGERML